MKYILTILFCVSPLFGAVSATSIRAEQIKVTRLNKDEFKIDLFFVEKSKNKTCITATAPRKYKNNIQLGLHTEFKDKNQNTIFNGTISASADDDQSKVRYSFCISSDAKVSFAFIPYGYFNNGLVTAYLDITELLK